MKMREKILKVYIVFSFILFWVPAAFAANLDALKADFLQGNYRRVIFEGSVQAGHFNIQGSDELNYLLGLSYLKEDEIGQAQVHLRRILNNPLSKFKEQALLSLGDTYLIRGQYREAEDIYKRLLEDSPDTPWRAAVAYRMSHSGYRSGNREQFNEYLSKLRRDFPLSLELRSNTGMPRSGQLPVSSGDFSVQVGFFVKNPNAVNLRDKLMDLGYPSFIEGSKEGYRVKVGRFKTQKEALDMENRLSQEGFPTKLCP